VSWKRRIAAVCEVFGAYLAGLALVTVAVRLVDFTARNPLLSLTADISNAALFSLSVKLLAFLALLYAGYFVFAGPIDWWHRRRGLSEYGLTRANQS
jgi:hypothetical protein